MKLIPFPRFGGRHADLEDEPAPSLPAELPDIPVDEDAEGEAESEEGEEEKEEEENKDEESKDRTWNNDDELLKVFTDVDEEFVDNSGLTADMEDIPAEELLLEARALASAFGVRVVYEEQEG